MKHDRLALRKTKRLLLDWANLAALSDDLLDSMVQMHKEVFSSFAYKREALKDVIEIVRRFLRLAWQAHDPRERDWWLFTARQEYVRAVLGTRHPISRSGKPQDVRRLIMGVPPETAFDRAVSYAQRMSYCEGPECEEPFFLRGPKRERYCSHCKRDAELRRKRKYYHAKGKLNRKHTA
jgi:hypothetical protein